MLRLATELHSEKEYVITYHDLKAQMDVSSPDPQVQIAEVTSGQVQDIEELCGVWPAEFGTWRPEHLKLKLIHDLEEGNWCFCARAQGKIIGAVWASKRDAIIESCPVPHMPGERVVGRAFIVPEARGLGLSKLLYDHAVKVARDRGVPQMFGFTFPHRVASIKAKLRVGFRVVGVVKVKTRWGKSAYEFTPQTQYESPNV